MIDIDMHQGSELADHEVFGLAQFDVDGVGGVLILGLLVLPVLGTVFHLVGLRPVLLPPHTAPNYVNTDLPPTTMPTANTTDTVIAAINADWLIPAAWLRDSHTFLSELSS